MLETRQNKYFKAKVLTIFFNYNFHHSYNTLYQLQENFTLLDGKEVSA